MDENKLLKSVMEKETNTGRLQSLKLPRDLSLGIKQSKKQYAPNLNVVRNKDKTKEFLKKNDQKRNDRSTRRDRNERTDMKQRYIQSNGVFSQGSAEMKRSTLHSEKRVTFREGSSVSNMVRPSINRNQDFAVDRKPDDVILDELMNCDRVESDEEKIGFQPLTLSTIPIKGAKKKLKLEQVKKESDSDDEVSLERVKTTLPDPLFEGEFYSDENPAISLVKLPDSFAGKGLSDDPSVKKLFDYPLSGMLEGEIGKLVIRKSGKMEMHIGRIKYELISDNTFESKEELATILSSDESDKTSIAVLGSVLNNFIMFPDYESVLKK